jgi:Leucine-rich repeat (LRR) protein
MICLDIWQLIFDYCDITDQLNILSMCKIFNDELQIKKLKNFKIDDIILKQKKFYNLEELHVSHNEKIKNVNHLTKLKILDCSHSCGIYQEGIIDLKFIEELYASYNGKIKNVNHLTKLKILDCSCS